MSIKRKLMAGSILADPKFRAPGTQPDVPDHERYGVEREDDEIVVMLGPKPPFRLPVTTARKFALLILKKCGGEDGGEIQEQTGEVDGRRVN